MRLRGPRTYRDAAVPFAAAVLLLVVAGSAAGQNAPRLLGLGDLPGGETSSLATAVSADGLVVVGASDGAAGEEAVRWTEAGGLQGLGDLSGGEHLSFAAGTSADGAVVVGTGAGSDASLATRWTPGSGMVALDAFSCSLCPDTAAARGVSRDGGTAVGAGARRSFLGSLVFEAARWSGGSLSGLGHLPGGGEASGARGVSQDGSVIVGESDSGDGVRAFVWTPSAGMQALPDGDPSWMSSSATAVSADGSVVVGFAATDPASPALRQAIRWSGAGYGVVEELGFLPGGDTSRALAVSGDGALVAGTARGAGGDDAAFLWDAASGMRSLREVLLDDYGVDAGAWELLEARGVSDLNAAGESVVVGVGTGPSGDPEGFVAVLSPTACNDGVDGDGDGLADFPDDPGCVDAGDRSEGPDCSDGLDQDGDGAADHPADAECTGPEDATEEADCADGVDGDGDGLVDFPADPGCRDAEGLIEDPACDDGVDQDGDGFVDFPDDPGCVAADDFSEVADCSDGIDGDGDGLVDFPADPDCEDESDPAEDPQCDDRLDNDVDGLVDYPDANPACTGPDDPIEAAPCSDGVDQDGDGLLDHLEDPGCASKDFGSESPVALAAGDLLVTSRAEAALFRVDPATGVQTTITRDALLGAPEGVGLRGDGALVVADPSGLVAVRPADGAQRRLGPELAAFESLQLVFDDAGDVQLLHGGGLSTVAWTWAGAGMETPLFPVPGGDLALLLGDALARESDGRLLVGGFGAGGDGVFRVDPDAGTATVVTSGFSGDVWKDLAVEPAGTVVAVGSLSGTGPSVVRIDPVAGTTTSLSTSGWTDPVAVAVAGGSLWVAEAGSCDGSGCSGSALVEIDAASGVELQRLSGGLIGGRMDLAVVEDLPACANGVDDDGDGDVDFGGDSHCRRPDELFELPACSDGVDNDGDGLVDYDADPGCGSAQSDRESPACNDGLDNDGDGNVDLDDGNCKKPSRNKERKCGLGAEAGLAGALLALRARRAWRRRRPRAAA